MAAPPQRDRRPVSPWAFAGIGLEIALPVVLLLYGGYRLDGWAGNENPWFTLLGALLGIAVGLYTFLKRLLPAARGGSGTAP
jgi:LPXTG-motif cell wall-anchored protein